MRIAPHAAASGRLPAGESEAARQRWPQDKLDAFRAMAPAALVLVATDGPVSVTVPARGGDGGYHQIGGNRGVWPARLAKSGAWRDTVTATYDRDPFVEIAARLRVWCLTEPDRDRLAASVADLIAQRSERDGGRDGLRNGFLDLGPDLDLDLFGLEILDVARRIGVTVFDDDGLSVFLDRVLASIRALRRSGKSVRDMPRTTDAIARQLLGKG